MAHKWSATCLRGESRHLARRAQELAAAASSGAPWRLAAVVSGRFDSALDAAPAWMSACSHRRLAGSRCVKRRPRGRVADFAQCLTAQWIRTQRASLSRALALVCSSFADACSD